MNFKMLTMSLAFITAGVALAEPDTRIVDTQFIQGNINLEKNTIVLPLRRGSLPDGRNVFYVLTNTDNQMLAQRFGIGFSPSLKRAAESQGTRMATRGANGRLVFESGTVDFSPVRGVVAGDAPNIFPPKEFHAGATADADYSPFVKVGDDVFSASIVAFNIAPEKLEFKNGEVDYTLVHDKVVSISAQSHSVELQLTPGFAAGESVVYLSFESNVEMAAAMEGAILAPALENLKDKNVGLNIFALANGATGKENPNRQGFSSALLGEGAPLNILEGLPSVAGGYSPLWDLNLGVFTDAAIAQGKQTLLKDDTSVYNLADAGFLTGPGGAVFGPVGISINCPLVAIVK